MPNPLLNYGIPTFNKSASMSMQITPKLDFEKGNFSLEVLERFNDEIVSHHALLMDATDQAIMKSLCALGWTPPKGQTVQSIMPKLPLLPEVALWVELASDNWAKHFRSMDRDIYTAQFILEKLMEWQKKQ